MHMRAFFSFSILLQSRYSVSCKGSFVNLLRSPVCPIYNVLKGGLGLLVDPMFRLVWRALFQSPDRFGMSDVPVRYWGLARVLKSTR